MNIVPNRFPRIPSTLKLAVIGECPGPDEERLGIPFVGTSGRFFSALLSRAGLSIDTCFVGNVCQHRPPNNDISLFPWEGMQVQHGLAKLKQDIAAFNPNVIVLLGNVPLKAAKDPFTPHPLTPKQFRFKNSAWRGSVFRCDEPLSPFNSYKCVPTYHPAYALRDYSVTPLLQFDLRKAVTHSGHNNLALPQRNFIIPKTCDEVLDLLNSVFLNKPRVAIDIEGYVRAMSCISFATSPTNAFIVPFFYRDHRRCWTPEEDCRILRSLANVLEDTTIEKVLQNSLYDRFVLHYSYGIRVRNVIGDTMLQHWELYSELEKALAVQCSLYTDEPYYKSDGRTDDDTTFFEYCCRDSAVTLEIHNYLERVLHPPALTHYHFNRNCLNPLLYMEMQGILYDPDKASNRRATLLNKLYEEQAKLNKLTGHCLPWDSLASIKERAYSILWTKKRDRVRKEHIPTWSRFQRLISTPSPTLSTIGEIEDLLEVSLNVDSKIQFPPYLYETLELPTQYNENSEGKKVITTDYEALLKLSKILQQRNEQSSRNIVIEAAITIRALSTRAQMLSISTDCDSRIRCGYNIVGTNTGRISCYESPTGSGYNLQTIPNYPTPDNAPGNIAGDRDLFLSNPGYHFFQCDLKGADGWTVAAYSAMLGDDTMFLDYRFGLKPANILALMLRGSNVDFKNRDALKAASKLVGKDDWDYFACKRVQHGCSYLEGGLTVSRNILKDSEGKMYMSPKEADKLKELFFERYRGVRLWHNWLERRLMTTQVLTAASGQVRQFFGRREEILTKAVAFEPQANTTYITNLALQKLWRDRDNFNSSTKAFRIQPLHQVHDALCGQFLKEDSSWAAKKIQDYFNNPIEIAGLTLVIPYDGAYGESWGNLNVGKL